MRTASLRDEVDRRERNSNADPGQQRGPVTGSQAYEDRDNRCTCTGDRGDDCHRALAETAVEGRNPDSTRNPITGAPGKICRPRMARHGHGDRGSRDGSCQLTCGGDHPHGPGLAEETPSEIR